MRLLATKTSLLVGSIFVVAHGKNDEKSVAIPTQKPKICKVGGSGLMFPLFGDDEQNWPNSLRIILYLLGLLWCFMGVGIVSDVFMGAIEALTSKKKRVKVKETGRHTTVKVWNDTVANLTLMALGSSAPEILLSLIELLGNDVYSGELGPSTIVGSAAFNLFVISAVCVSAIIDGTRYIKDTVVFAVTASYSIFAYVWLVIILMLITPNVVDIWEGVLTFLFFPLLVMLAYMADIGMLSGKTRNEVVQNFVTAAELSKEELASMLTKIRQEFGQNLTDEDAIYLLEKQTAPPRSRAEYRISVTRALTASLRVPGLEAARSNSNELDVQKFVSPAVDEDGPKTKNQITIQFAHAKYAVLECCPHIVLQVTRTGDTSKAVSVTYETKDGTAHAGTDYIADRGKVEFFPHETAKEIKIGIVDDTEYEDDEDFYVELGNPQLEEHKENAAPIPDEYTVGEIGSVEDTVLKVTDNTQRLSQSSVSCVLGTITTATVTIIDDDEPGVLAFQKETETVSEPMKDETLKVVVVRKFGSSGTVQCKYYTEGDSAISSLDFEEAEGTLIFEKGQMSAEIEITIKARGRYDRTDMFRVYITEASGGSRFDHTTDGGNESCIMTVFIKADQESQKKVDALQGILQMNWGKVRLGHENYAQQFTEALWPNGSREEAKEASTGDIVLHIISMPWKLVFAMIPPTDYAEGWVCFFVALVFIGGVTAIIGDIAALFGCTIGVPDSITAITFVALGTSLPDTFASKSAAQQDEYADASIGNVTGSNSVNVFLGLGLSWTIGACYWSSVDDDMRAEWAARYKDTDVPRDYPDGAFTVIAGDLGFSVIVFSTAACIAILLLLWRRKAVGGELGGPQPQKGASSVILVALWLVYVGLSSWKAMDTLSKNEGN